MKSDLPKIDNNNRWDGGIADYEKRAAYNEVAFLRSLNYRDDPNQLTLVPKTVKESGTTVLGLPKDGDRVGDSLFYYDEDGRIYERDEDHEHTLLRTVANSHGNGMKYYGEDDYLYYARDKTIGRYGQMFGGEIPGVPQTFDDDFLGSSGGVPQNTHAADLEASSSQYFDRADTASLSITSDLAIEAWIKPESLPAVGSSMVLFSKWDVNTNLRSYKLELYAISGYFGDGSDGPLTINSNTTDTPIDSACTGTAGASTLSATNASFAAGQYIFIHQTKGNAGTIGYWERNKISSYSAGTINLENPLTYTFTAGAQVIVMKQYTNVTVNAACTWTAKDYNGTVGGILVFLANGTVTITGSISANGCGYRGGTGGNNATGNQGEGIYGTGNTSTGANITGGGAGSGGVWFGGGAGAGGGHANSGSGGAGAGTSGTGGSPGGTHGSASLASSMVFGGAGGGGGQYYGGGSGGTGGDSGGIVFITGATISVGGTITSAGANGTTPTVGDAGGGGGGSGGSILLKAQTATLGNNLLSASGGAGGSFNGSGGTGGAGSVGRIHLDYLTSYTYTASTPTLDVTQDNSLATTTTYQLRLGLSTNGTAEEFLTKNTTISTGQWYHVAVSWDASDAQAEFFQDGVSLGSSTGAATSLNNNTSKGAVGCDFNNTARNFYDGKIDEVRVWNTERTQTQINNNKSVYVATAAIGLAAWYRFNNNANDSQASGNNNLTAQNSPTYTTDVPFSAATTRLDLDQSNDQSGQTYTCPTAIDEGATHRQTFVPAKDPQKSIEINFGTKGAGNVEVTVHDALNRVVHAKTVDTTNLPASGRYEFLFDTTWRPVRGASYHFHITSSDGAATVVTGTTADLETCYFNTYYQFLVEDTDYHPIEQMLNFLVVGNERYLAKYSASGGYTPHHITLPSGWKIRCFAKWREYLAIGCWKGDNVYDNDQGIIFFWNGYSATYDFYVEVPEGAINAMFSSRGLLYVWAGYHGDLLEYRGGDYAEVIKRAPKMVASKYIETLPKAVTMWDALLRWGIGGASNSSDVERGVYTWGRRKASNPQSLSYDHPISTGNRASSNVKVGLLYPMQGQLLIGWQDNETFGMDVVDPTAAVAHTGTVEKDIKDFGGVYKNKKALTVRADFKTLAAGEKVRVKYKLDRASDWTTGDWVESTNDYPYRARLPINLGNHREVQYAADLETSVSTSPTLLELTLEEDMLPTDTMI